VFELGIITDEVSDDFGRSCELAREWGMRYAELRTLWGKNVLELSEAEVERAREVLDLHGLAVCAIASPVFKSPLRERSGEVEADFTMEGAEDFEGQLRLLERAADLCRRFGTEKVRVFTFWREGWDGELVRLIASRLVEASQVAAERGVLLVVENEPVCNARHGRELGELFAEIRARSGPVESIAPLWDPGNALYAGEQRPYPDGYEALGGGAAHVHLKDVVWENGEPRCVPLGWGEVDYAGQLRRLAEDGYRGPLVLEPHYRPEGVAREEAARAAVEAARKVLRETFGES
jgi:L-ribulose-5-phosphate 3-epimerase